MLIDKLFVPNKLCNKAVEKICRDFIYLRQYYQKNDLKFFDCSNTTSLKIDLQNSIRIYLNDDQTADICVFGPGLKRDLTFLEVIKEILSK